MACVCSWNAVHAEKQHVNHDSHQTCNKRYDLQTGSQLHPADAAWEDRPSCAPQEGCETPQPAPGPLPCSSSQPPDTSLWPGRAAAPAAARSRPAAPGTRACSRSSPPSAARPVRGQPATTMRPSVTATPSPAQPSSRDSTRTLTDLVAMQLAADHAGRSWSSVCSKPCNEAGNISPTLVPTCAGSQEIAKRCKVSRRLVHLYVLPVRARRRERVRGDGGAPKRIGLCWLVQARHLEAQHGLWIDDTQAEGERAALLNELQQAIGCLLVQVLGCLKLLRKRIDMVLHQWMNSAGTEQTAGHAAEYSLWGGGVKILGSKPCSD